MQLSTLFFFQLTTFLSGTTAATLLTARAVVPYIARARLCGFWRLFNLTKGLFARKN